MNKNNAQNNLVALDIFYRVLSGCSLNCLFKLAKSFAFIVAHTRNRVALRTRQNITLCFPELDTQRRDRLVQESLQHTSYAFFELAALWYQPVEQVLNNIITRDVDETFGQSSSARIIIAPHQGSWELLNLWLATNGPLYSLYKPAKSGRIDQLIFNKRSRNQAKLVPANTTGLRTLLRALKQHSSCMILPDQRPAQNTAQIMAPFFGYPAATTLLVKKLATKVDCDIFIAAVTRDLTSAGYHLRIEALDREKIVSDDLQSASYLNNRIENFIREQPGQYQWSYRRYTIQTYQKKLNNQE